MASALLIRLGRHLPLARGLVDGRDIEWAAQPSMQSGTAENIFLKIFVSFMQWFMAVCVKELFVFLPLRSIAAERLKGILNT